DEIPRVTPIAPGVEISEMELLLQAHDDGRDTAGHLARDESLAAYRALVIEENAVGGMKAVGLAVVDRDPVGIELRHRIGAARIEWGRLVLRRRLHLAVELRGRGLIEAHLLAEPENADRLKKPQRPHGVGVGRILRRFEAHLHVAL